MRFIKIEQDHTGNDNRTQQIFLQVAKWHNLTPKLWIPDHQPSDEEITDTVQRIKSTDNKDLFLMIAEGAQGQIHGFIWANKLANQPNSVKIISLYVNKASRGKGFATRLKALLEEWCKQEGIQTIHTTTHYTNEKMIALNQKLGYKVGMVSMTKTL